MDLDDLLKIIDDVAAMLLVGAAGVGFGLFILLAWPDDPTPAVKTAEVK
jgi:hypothetical protein